MAMYLFFSISDRMLSAKQFVHRFFVVLHTRLIKDIDPKHISVNSSTKLIKVDDFTQCTRRQTIQDDSDYRNPSLMVSRGCTFKCIFIDFMNRFPATYESPSSSSSSFSGTFISDWGVSTSIIVSIKFLRPSCISWPIL